MFAERSARPAPARRWRGWREAVFATCTAWLVLQNVGLLALVVWGHPGSALAAGAAIARTAIHVSGQLFMLAVAAGLGLAFAAWLVHAPTVVPGSSPAASDDSGVDDER